MRRPFLPICGLISATLLVSCGGSPASVEDIEELMTENFSEDDAEVTWVSVEKSGDEEDDFVAVMDITDPEREGGSRTARCTGSATTNSNSYSCQSTEPSVPDAVEAEIKTYYEGQGGEVRELDLARNDDGNLNGDIVLFDPRNGQVFNNICEAEIEEGTRFEWRCGPADQIEAGEGA